MTNDELTNAVKQGTARILRAFELKLDLITAELGGDPMLNEAKRLLSESIVKAETSEVSYVFGPNAKVYRVGERDQLSHLEQNE